MKPFLLTVLAALPLAAQDSPAPAPGKPLLTVHLAGPAAFRQAFLATNLGSLLAAKETTPLVRPMQDAFLDAVDPGGALWPLLVDYEGSIDLLAWFEGERNFQGSFRAALRATPDGHSDLGALAQVLSTLVMLLPGEKGTVQLAGQERATHTEGIEHLVLPTLVDGTLIVAYANGDLEKHLGGMVAAVLALPPPNRRTPPLHLTMDIQVLVRALRAMDADDKEGPQIMREVFGTDALGQVTLSLQGRGPRVSLEMTLSADAGERGIFAAFFPDRQGIPELLQRVPVGCRAYKAGHLDLAHLADRVMMAFAIGFNSGDRDEIDAEMAKELGFHLIDDFLGHLGTEALVLGDWSLRPAESDIAPIDNPFEGTCFAWKLTDPQAIEQVWPKVIASMQRSMGGQADDTEHRGVTIHAFNLFPFGTGMYLAQDGKVGLMAFGDKGMALLEGVVDGPRVDRLELPRGLKAFAPPGLNSIGRAPLRQVIEGELYALLSMMDMSIGRAAPELAELLPQIEPFQELLEKHNLLEVDSLTGYAQGKWTFRMFW